MKIVFVAPRYHTNQVAVVESLLGAGHQVEFHVNRIGATEDHSLLQPRVFKNSLLSQLLIKVFGEGDGDIQWNSPSVVAYFKQLKRSKADVIVIRNPTRLFSMVSATVARMLGVKIIFYTQTPLYRHWSRPKTLQAKLLIGLFNAKWMTPLNGDPDAGKRLPGMHYVPFPVKPGLTNNGMAGQGALKLLMVGKYNERKNARLLLEALTSVTFDFSLTVIGECVTEQQRELKQQLHNYVHEHDLGNKVTLLESLPFSEMSKIYSQHDVYVLPARNEPASISVLESMASGLMAICSSTCGTAGYIKEGETGFVFKSDNVASLATALANAHQRFHSVGKSVVGLACRQHAAQTFSRTAYLRALQHVIEARR